MGVARFSTQSPPASGASISGTPGRNTPGRGTPGRNAPGRALLRGVVYPVVDRLLAPRALICQRELERFQWLDPETIRRRQWTKLADLLRHAYDTTAYYRRVFDAAGLDPADFVLGRLTPETFARIPVLTKAGLRDEFPAGIVSTILGSRRPLVGHTSGTTQAPLTVYKDPDTCPFDQATHVWLNGWASFHRGERFLYLTHYRRSSRLRDRIWHALTGRRYFPAEPILDRDGEAVADLLDRWRPDGLFGIPPVLELAAATLLASGRPLRYPPRAVIYHSSLLSPAGQALVREAFGGSALYSRYGTIEFGSWVAQTCPAQARAGLPPGENLHVNDFRYLVEVLGPRGGPAEPGEVGRLVITDLFNRVMPLLRYDIGDLASLGPPSPCACGRGLTTIRTLDGRVLDSVVLRSGRLVPTSFLYTPMREHLCLWWEYQFVQPDLDHLILSVVPRSPSAFGSEEARRLEGVLREVLVDPMEVTVRIVDTIPFEPSGKRPFLKILTRLRGE